MSLVLCLVMVLGLLPMQTYAEERYECLNCSHMHWGDYECGGCGPCSSECSNSDCWYETHCKNCGACYMSADNWCGECGWCQDCAGDYCEECGECEVTKSGLVLCDYTDAVLWAVKVAVTSGTTAATFSPDEYCTRAQIVTFIYRALAK